MTKLITIDTSSKNASISYSVDGKLIDEKSKISEQKNVFIFSPCYFSL